MFPIIALWSHPRSMSTAIERVMRARGDCRCFHEPFIYDYYVHHGVRRIPHFVVDPAQPRSYPEIRAHLLAAAEKQTVFLKDMSYYVVPALFDDLDFARRITHAFLIRDPLAAIHSYFKLDPGLTLEEIGLEAQWRHFAWLESELGQAPPVLEAEAVRQDPQGLLGAFWRRVGLPPAPQAFDWQPAKTPEDWSQVAGWHGKVADSHGIEPPRADETERRREAFEAAVLTAPRLRDFLDHHKPFHEKLRRHALTAD